MPSKRQDLIFASIMAALGLLVLLVWIPNDIETGMIEKFRRQAFAVSDADPYFLFKSPISVVFLLLSVAVVVVFSRGKKA